MSPIFKEPLTTNEEQLLKDYLDRLIEYKNMHIKLSAELSEQGNIEEAVKHTLFAGCYLNALDLFKEMFSNSLSQKVGTKNDLCGSF